MDRFSTIQEVPYRQSSLATLVIDHNVYHLLMGRELGICETVPQWRHAQLSRVCCPLAHQCLSIYGKRIPTAWDRLYDDGRNHYRNSCGRQGGKDSTNQGIERAGKANTTAS